MAWTQEEDAKLRELHGKRLGVRFISVWLRQPAAAVRARLVELGLEKPLSQRGKDVLARSARPAGANADEIDVDTVSEDDEDDGDLRASRGCPRGHLISEQQIAALYRSAGCDYR